VIEVACFRELHRHPRGEQRAPPHVATELRERARRVRERPDALREREADQLIETDPDRRGLERGDRVRGTRRGGVRVSEHGGDERGIGGDRLGQVACRTPDVLGECLELECDSRVRRNSQAVSVEATYEHRFEIEGLRLIHACHDHVCSSGGS